VVGTADGTSKTDPQRRVQGQDVGVASAQAHRLLAERVVVGRIVLLP
jgi:hypothetical protein